MSDAESRNHLSVFWDFENVHEDFGTHRELTERIREAGKVVKAYAFADWTNRRRMAEELHNLGYDVIHVPDSRDNAADYKMAAYIMDHMVHYPETTCYVIITGDGDFKLIAGAIRQRGLGLWIISNPIITASELTDLATKYTDIHSFRRISLDCPEIGDCQERVRSITEMRRIMGGKLHDAIQTIIEAGNKPGIGNVKYVMSSLNPSFNERELGFLSWNEFVRWAESEGYIVKEGELPSTILKLPDTLSDDMSKLSEENREAFAFLVRVVEEGIDEGHPFTLPKLNEELQERGLDISEVGFSNLPDFVFSAEKRSLVR
ncbi:MAG: NYN domain-containing protein, partial [Promethearchaeota archaeon]